ncbi:MAG: UvrD-helicase domain-containing protein, partial [Terriglobales bacterium]
MTVAVSKDFLEAYARIPRSQQKKVREFIEQFQLHPEAGGARYEKLHAGKDFYSARIDQAWRAIIFHPPQGDVYVLSWVDQHDAAYQWAENRSIQVNPETGALQVVDVTALAPPAPAAVAAAPLRPATGLFAGVKDKHLLRLGVPEALLPLVRGMQSDGDLEAAQSALPQEAYEALLMLAMGYSLEDAFREAEKPEEPAAPAPIDTADVSASLQHEDSKRRFFVVREAEDLATVLNAPLEQWRVFLHPRQRRLVEMQANGPVRVLGGAGTGKTVAAMHRARFLAETVFPRPGDRILLTTFTRNLAVDIETQLSQICSAEALSRIEVVNLDAWVANFLRKRGFRYDVVFGSADELCWSRALGSAPASARLPESFYRAEWEEVIQAQNIASVEEYVRAPRLGRGTRLSREAKRAIWPVFQEYRAQLNELGKREFVDLVREARTLIEYQTLPPPYRAIVVDEAQDMSAEAFRLIRRLAAPAPNDLFIVGDAFQRIYRHRASLGQCGIDIRGRGRKLKINYRTTEETRRFAIRILDGLAFDDLNGGGDDQTGYVSLLHGEPPEVRHCEGFEQEADFLASRIRQWQSDASPLASICLVARTNDLVQAYRDALGQRGFVTHEIRREKPERANLEG